ncbi:SDR family NAD(P)-dependent oxidoreductase [Oligoflexus tunisiensis]|uniref:SDR family NAD(P)-dependent oxidoreductase n=1 Tax=Oligoflexus tunisiensis TaxID=708132 RepID=UPI000A7961B0|nr:SDR family oxidoreductase [Oligoflexus tunisiensis]
MTEKWAIVTGASGGIGLDIARLLAARDYHLVLVARSKDKLEEAQKELAQDSRQVRIMVQDLTRPGACDALVKQTDSWGIVPEVLINNAGVGAWGPFLDGNLELARDMMTLNMDALVQLTHHYGRRMREQQRQGYMLQVASSAAFQPLPSYAVYAATKSFVLSFSRAFNYEARRHGISSTALCPGPTSTSFFDRAQHKLNSSFQALMMKSPDVARQGLDAMFARDECHVAGFMNKVTAALPRIMPTSMIIRSAALFMK